MSFPMIHLRTCPPQATPLSLRLGVTGQVAHGVGPCKLPIYKMLLRFGGRLKLLGHRGQVGSSFPDSGAAA